VAADVGRAGRRGPCGPAGAARLLPRGSPARRSAPRGAGVPACAQGARQLGRAEANAARPLPSGATDTWYDGVSRPATPNSVGRSGSANGVTLSDEEGWGERTPTRRLGRARELWRSSTEAPRCRLPAWSWQATPRAGDLAARSLAWRLGDPGASIAAVGGLPADGGSDGQRLVNGCDESGGLGPSNTAKGTAHD